VHGHQRTRVPDNAPLSPCVKRSTPEDQNDANERQTKRILVHRKWCQTAHAPRSKLPPSTGSGAKPQQQRQQRQRVSTGNKSSATARDATKWPSVTVLVFRLVCLFVNCAFRCNVPLLLHVYGFCRFVYKSSTHLCMGSLQKRKRVSDLCKKTATGLRRL